MMPSFDITPIFHRDLIAAARERDGRRLHAERSSFAGMLLAVVLATFGTAYYWSGGYVTNRTMAQVAHDAAGWCALFHFGIFGSILVRGAWSIAKERDRSTLEFLLATPMTNTEIVLGKLASCLVMTFATLAAGFPAILLFHVLGGIDLRLIALCYASAVSSILFLSALAIWISVEASNIRLAYVMFLVGTLAWAIGPFSVWVFFPRFGIKMPGWLAAANGWLVLCSPIAVAYHLARGLSTGAQLSNVVARMVVLQLLGSMLLTIGAIARLRSAHRMVASGAQHARERQGRRLVWRLWRRPQVGDDPILWREMYTTRGNGLIKVLGVLFSVGLLAALASATYHHAIPALVEVWRHGYGSGVPTDVRPEFNPLVRTLAPNRGTNEPLDARRTEFNLFLRYVTSAITFFVTFLVAVSAAEIIELERRKETWNSLLATPLTARAIVQSALLAIVWRVRQPLAIQGIAWTIGLIAGAVHPLGFVLGLLNLAASVWLFGVWGILASVRAKHQGTAAAVSLNLPLLTLLFLALPFLLPGRFNSVLLGAGSHLFVGWMSLVSYGDVRAALHYAAYPPLEWMGIGTGEGPFLALATCVLGIVAYAAGGWCAWRYAIAHFDRLVGRPWRAAPAAASDPSDPSDRSDRAAAGLNNRTDRTDWTDRTRPAASQKQTSPRLRLATHPSPALVGMSPIATRKREGQAARRRVRSAALLQPVRAANSRILELAARVTLSRRRSLASRRSSGPPRSVNVLRSRSRLPVFSGFRQSRRNRNCSL